MIRVSAHFKDKTFDFTVNPYDKIETITKKVEKMFYPFIYKNEFGLYEKDNGELKVIYNARRINENKTFLEEGIEDKSHFFFIDSREAKGAGPIDNLDDEKAEDLGFDLNLIKRNKLFINLIHLI